MLAARVSQGLVDTRSVFEVSNYCLAEHFLQISQGSHNSLMSAFIPGQYSHALALSIVLLVPK